LTDKDLGTFFGNQAIPKSHWHHLRFSQHQKQPETSTLVPSQLCPKSTQRIPASASYLEAKHNSGLLGERRLTRGPWVSLPGPCTRRTAIPRDARGSTCTGKGCCADRSERAPRGYIWVE